MDDMYIKKEISRKKIIKNLYLIKDLKTLNFLDALVLNFANEKDKEK